MLRSRILHAVILFFGIWVLNFFLIRLSPGDATHLYWGPQTNRQSLETLREQRGLKQPLHEQFMFWTARLLRGDFGYSWARHRPVSEILKEAIPATLQLMALALVVNFMLGCLWGALAGIHANGLIGRWLNFSSLALYSAPVFWLAMILILLFSAHLRWLPASQMITLLATEAGFWSALADRIRHLILPVAVLGLTGAAATSRYVQERMKEALQQEYVRLAEAKGLSKSRIYFHHAFRNALLPVITLLGLSFPFLLSGAFVVEVIFAWPGMGRVTYEAVFARDYPVIFAVNLIAAVLVIAGNLLSDVLYQFVDPRVRLK